MKYLILLLALAACTTKEKPRPEPIVVIKEVLIPVAAPCVPYTLGAAPEYVDTDAALIAAFDAAERYQLLWVGRGQRTSRLNEIEPIIASCPRGSSK